MTSDLRISASNEREWSEASINMSEHRTGSDVRPVQGTGLVLRRATCLG